MTLLQVLGADVAVEAGGRGEPLAALRAAQRQRVATGGRRGVLADGGASAGAALDVVRLAVSFEERHAAEPATALLALGPHPPPLLLRTHTHTMSY